MTEINGFKIDKYNQYNLQENKKESTCPLCSESRSKKNDKCARLNWQTGIGHCFHCGEVFQLHTFQKKEKPKVYAKPPPQKFERNYSDKILEAFKARCISENTLIRAGVSEGRSWMPKAKKEVNCVLFNYYLDGELINIKYRGPGKDFKMYKDAEKILYNIDSIRLPNEAVIVEGEFDALAFIEAGINNVVSVPNGFSKDGNLNLDYLDEYYDYFENKDRVFIAVDNDEAGRHGAKELIRRIGAEKCYIVDFRDCKDANEFLIKHGTIALSTIVDCAEPVPLEDVVTLEDQRAELNNFYLNGMKAGNTIGLSNFDRIFSTYTGQFITVTGIPSSGKSDFVDQMCVGYNLSYGWKVGYASPENEPHYLHMDKIARKLYGRKPSSDDLYSDNWLATTDYMNSNFFFMKKDAYTLEMVLEKGAELVKRKGIKVLVIDPMNKIRLDQGNKDNSSDYLLKIDAFCKKYNVLVILVAHPRKMGTDKDGNMLEPSMYDIKGTSEIYDMSYHGLLVARDYERNLVKVKVLKVKFGHLGENHAEVWFHWNRDNGRYEPILDDPQFFDTSPPVPDFTSHNILYPRVDTLPNGPSEERYNPVIEAPIDIPDDEIPF